MVTAVNDDIFIEFNPVDGIYVPSFIGGGGEINQVLIGRYFLSGTLTFPSVLMEFGAQLVFIVPQNCTVLCYEVGGICYLRNDLSIV